MLQRALVIAEKSCGVDHPLVAEILFQLGLVQMDLNHFEAAETQLRRSEELFIVCCGVAHRRVSVISSNLAAVYTCTNRPVAAEEHYRRSISRMESVMGKTDPRLGTAYNNLAVFLRDLRKFDEAELESRRSLEIVVAAAAASPEAGRKWEPELMRLSTTYRTILTGMRRYTVPQMRDKLTAILEPLRGKNIE